MLINHRTRAVVVLVALAAVLAGPAGSGLAAPRPAVVQAGQADQAAPRRAQATAAAAARATQAQATQAQAALVAGQVAVAPPRVVAKAAILADEATGQVLFDRNAGVGRAMASTTKVMTALLTLERLDEDRVVVIGAGPPKVGEESLRLKKGERLTVRQLLLGLLVKSANDAAVALAEAVDGSEAAFVRRMNRKAAALRLTATHYVTPYGLDRPGHQTSARDLARLWEVAMRRADFRALVGTRAARLPGGPLSLRRFVTTNQLLGSYRWVVGGKTGFTNRAGRCLVASASRGGRRLVAVAMGTPNAFADVRALFEYGFSKYVRARLAQRGQPVSEAPGRPAGSQTNADVDALVRLDQLDEVRLALAPGGASAWVTAADRRVAQVPLAPLPPGGPAASTTTMAAPPPAAATTTQPAGAASTAATTTVTATPPATAGADPAATLTVGALVRPLPVPPGAPAPTIDPSLRRTPP
jgi:D-alanyl-D-alanine carboxypeptidase (penicillin-binding protein 5/6)